MVCTRPLKVRRELTPEDADRAVWVLRKAFRPAPGDGPSFALFVDSLNVARWVAGAQRVLLDERTRLRVGELQNMLSGSLGLGYLAPQGVQRGCGRARGSRGGAARFGILAESEAG